MKMKTRELAVCGLMVALSVVLGGMLTYNVQVAGVNGVKLGLGPLPIMLTGFLFGPQYALVSGFAADLVKANLFPTGAYMPVFSLTYAFLCATPSFLVRLTRRGERSGLAPGYWPLFAGVLVSFIVWSTTANTLLLVTMFSSALAALLPARLAALILVPVYPPILRAMLAVYRKIKG